MDEQKEPVTETSTVTPETVTETPVVEQSSRDKNLAVMRKKLEAEEYARKQAEQRAYEAEQRMQSYQQPAQQQQPVAPVEEDDFAIDNEEYVQAKHIKTSNNKLKTKLLKAEQRLAEFEQKLAYFEAKVDTDALKDFNKVVSDENLKTLASLYPDDYQTMMSNPNLKAKSKTAYNMIKNYGIVDVPDTRDVDNRIAANKLKPQSAASQSPQAPATPLSRLNDYDRRVLTEADRDRIMAEVNRKKMLG